MRLSIALSPVLLLAACSGPKDAPPAGNVVPDPTPSATATPAVERSLALAGRWTGVEGMYLIVSPAGRAGRYRLEMQYDLDHKGVFDGRAADGGIAFVREGRREVLRSSDGDATGLKYLAGKRDCLTVKPGEGYCRD